MSSQREQAEETARREVEGIKDYLYTHQTVHVIRFLLYRACGLIEDDGARAFIMKEIIDELPPSSIGATCVSMGDVSCSSMSDETERSDLFITFRPCFRDHDMDPWLRGASPPHRKKVVDTISFILYVIRQQYARFMDDNDYIRDILSKALPTGKKDLSLKVDPSNVTLYLDESDDLRVGVFVEKEAMTEQINHDEMVTELLASRAEVGPEAEAEITDRARSLAIDYLTKRSIVWSEFLISSPVVAPWGAS